MRSIEIPDEQWIDFFKQFSREHAGWPVTIEVLSPDAGPQRLVHELPLQGLTVDVAGTRPSSVQIGAGDDPAANFSHVIDLPLHVRLADDEQDERGSGTIEIEPARGATTLVHFHRPA
jgi:hypothetical protein